MVCIITNDISYGYRCLHFLLPFLCSLSIYFYFIYHSFSFYVFYVIMYLLCEQHWLVVFYVHWTTLVMSLWAIKSVLWGQNFAADQNTGGGREGVEGSGSSFVDKENLSGSGILESEYQNCKGVGKSGLSSADEKNSIGGILEPEPSPCLDRSSRWSLPSRQRTDDQRSRGVGKNGLSSADNENLSDAVQDPELLSCSVESLRQSPPSRQKTYDQRSKGVGKGAEYSGLSFALFLPFPARRSRPSTQLYVELRCDGCRWLLKWNSTLHVSPEAPDPASIAITLLSCPTLVFTCPAFHIYPG